MKPKKYKIISSTNPAFLNIELYLTFDNPYVGQSCEVFGKKFTITQTGVITILSSEGWVLTLQEMPPDVTERQWGGLITNPNDLRINFEVDIFLKKKLIRLSQTDRLTEAGGVTMKAVAQFLINEWPRVESVSNISCPFMWDDEYKVLFMHDSWNFENIASISLTRQGSYTRYDENGRVIDP